ncbi:Ppx/GppA phosphatase family protein [Catenulispora yoronensis]|uniref:Ppx/GppA phosphatase family protein n=1 Tax=Catenulispora yoronensis TaxID=450799 RepID=A0ABP5FXD5_9ACTN
MRLGVLDVGSNTVHLLLLDAHAGAHPIPAFSHKVELHLSQLTDDHGAILPDGIERLCHVVAHALRVAEDKGAEEMLAFATSAVREAANGDKVLAEVRRQTGVNLEVLPGPDEARLTFLAVRRWFGWSAGRLLVLDIGGGSLEIAVGLDEMPDVSESLPLGASRLTHERLKGDPPGPEQIRELRKYVRHEVAKAVSRVARAGRPDRVVVTSKTFRQLARIAGAAPSAQGLYAPRSLRARDLTEWLPRLSQMSAGQRAGLPGVSPGRAGQLLAGAVVADAAFDLFGVEVAELCPWALREGVILRRLDTLVS